MQSKHVLVLVLVIILLPYLIISFYCHPAADDFEYAASSLRKGYWFSYLRDYHVWNGRYTSNLLVFASPLVWNSFTIYKLIPLVLLALTYSALLYFIQTITMKNVAGITLHLFTLTILTLYLCNAPSFAETFYWYTGAITYQLANILTLLYLALLFKFINHDYVYNQTLHIGLLLLLMPIISGFNEVIMLILLAFHFLFAIKWMQLKKENRGVIVLLLLFVLAASAIMIFSPGNKGRAANFPDNHQLFHSLYMTALQTGRFMFKWIVQVPFIAATILFFPVSKYLGDVSPFFKNKFYVSPLIAFLGLIGIIFLCVFPAYWNMGILGQHRTLNVAYFFFIPLWFMNVHLAVNYLTSKFSTEKYTLLTVLLLVIGLTFTNNGYIVSADILSGRAMTFNNEMITRYALIKAASKAEVRDVTVENLNAKPKAIYIYDITCDPENWINKCYSDYFGPEQVRLKVCD